MKHICHARGCEQPCKPEHLMCARHWKMVPTDLQAAVYKHYRDGQCDDMNPSLEWHEAADAAIKAVSAAESKADPRQLDMFANTPPKRNGIHD